MKNYVFEQHIIESRNYKEYFDEKTANELLRDIRNSLQIFKRAYADRSMTPDLWIQIDRIDHIAHGGDRFCSEEAKE